MFVIKRLVATGAAAVLLGCAAEGPTEPFTSLHHSPVSRPAGGRCETAWELLSEQGAFPQVYRINLKCNLRHLGLTSGVAIQEVDSEMNIINSTTYTAANGDELYATFSGTGSISFPIVTFEGTETVIGGTGRFAGASGESALEGSGSLLLASGRYWTAGSLRF